MKKFLFLGLLIAAAATASAQTRSFTAPTGPVRPTGVERPIPPVGKGQAAGALPRAARGGNPVQMINPTAPREYYGAPEDTVAPDTQDPRRYTGVILFGLRF